MTATEVPLLRTMLLLVIGHAIGCARPATDTTVIRDVSVIDVVAGTASPAVTLVLSGNRIAGLGPASEVTEPAGATVIDGRGRFLIPGLWDMHVHALQDGVHQRMFPMFIANGVTGIRDMNGPMPLPDIHALRDSVLSGEVVGPRFVAPGPLLDGPGRGPDALGPEVRWVDTPQAARDTVRALAARGADFIKPYNRLTPELYHAVVDEARAIGIPVMGHLPMSVDPLAAAEAGQTSMEHAQGVLEGSSSAGRELLAATETLMRTTGSGGSLSLAEVARLLEARRAIVGSRDPALAAQLFAAYARNPSWQCVTLISNRVFHLSDFEDFASDPRLRFIPPATREQMAGVSFQRGLGNPGEAFMRQRWEEQVRAVGEMHRAGVPILAGTDTGAAYTYPGFSLHDELELLVQAGLTPAAALRAATLEPARALGVTDSLGVIEPGAVADLVLLGANPLEEIGRTRDVIAVLANGRLFERPALDSLLAFAEAHAASDRAAGGRVR